MDTAKLARGEDVAEIIDHRNGAPVAITPESKVLPKRSAPKGLLPSTWTGRTLRVEYTDGFGAGVETSGTLLDVYPFGPVMNLDGAKTCLSWDVVRLVELVED